jgi:8-oxo-dGTP diphosphatase
MDLKSIIYVSAGFLSVNRRLLVVQRSENKKNALKWELPGGKLNENETMEDSLIREIKEELDIDIKIKDEIGGSEVELENQILVVTFFLIEGDPDKIKLNEHKQMKFAKYDDLMMLDLTEADRNFMVNYKSEIMKLID